MFISKQAKKVLGIEIVKTHQGKEVLEAIVKLNPEKIVYVSCNSTTMARDINTFIDNGYKVEEVQPVDMFPHTAHVEVVTLLTKEGREL